MIVKNKDVIIRISGTNIEAQAFFKEFEEESKKIGLTHDDKSIRMLPDKIDKKLLQNKKAKDVKISVTGKEDKVEEIIRLVAIEAEKELSPKSSSVNIKGSSQKCVLISGQNMR